MKRVLSLLVIVMILYSFNVQAQDRNNEDEVVKLDSRTRYNSVPNQLIIKFADNSNIRTQDLDIRKANTNPNLFALYDVLTKYSIKEVEQLLPNFRYDAGKVRSSRSYGGADVIERDLSQLFLITLNHSDNAELSNFALIEELKALEIVDYAEPNYICYSLGKPTDEIVFSSSEANFFNENGENNKTIATFNDPMRPLQWGLSAVHLPQLLDQPKLPNARKKIIAIVDTGVDILHPDLQANIWTNPAEESGATNADDDNNGFVDDIHGWDFVNQTGNMRDNNSHGTHCAGIAAAVSNNHIGITGANPDALIMPIIVMQSDGSGDIATIIKGINYAASNGADIISMSIGTYASSTALEQALAHAYQTAVLVAAAGNDAKAISSSCCPPNMTYGPMFPAAYTFVFGVQATMPQGFCINNPHGRLVCFSNYDCDGPAYSTFEEEKMYNYELSAPGVNILSTVPDGGYRSYNGTSMACPLVAGGISALLDRKIYTTQEMLFGDLINLSTEYHPVDLLAAYNAGEAPAILDLVTYEVCDTLYGDASWYADAGERIQIYPTIRTLWGATDSIKIWLEFQEFEDTTTLHFNNDTISFGRCLSAYSKGKSVNALDITVDNSVVDGRKIQLVICASSPNAQDIMRKDFTLQVTNGVKLFGVRNQNDTLWADKQYIVTSNLAYPVGDTLTIMPGTTIKVADDVSIRIDGYLNAVGTPDSMITFTRQKQYWNKFYINSPFNMRYINFEYMMNHSSSMTISWSGIFKDCVVRYSCLRTHILENSNRLCFYDNEFNDMLVSGYLLNSNVINNSSTIQTSPKSAYPFYNSDNTQMYNTNIFNNNPFNISINSTSINIFELASNYHGSTVESTIRNGINDFYQDFEWGVADISNRLNRPSSEAHGIVWKVEVNGFDAQDYFDSISPLGVGRQEFKVYFNRAMDTTVAPMVAMGVRPPYTQTAINEDGHWNEDSTVYTVYKTLTGRDAIDGLNRIYVDGAKDDEHFEIPYENKRFNVYVASSGSLSAGFQATAGLGKVELEWSNQEMNIDDFLGFNMYRYQMVEQINGEDTMIVSTDTIRLNTSLIADTVFTDYDVIPGERYYYFYKILRTSLTENSPSRILSCMPLSSIKGDANGSMNVDVADIITTINYVTNQNPQPFIFEAADINNDTVIDILDIVGIINIIMERVQDENKSANELTAIYTIEDSILYVNTPVALGGVQLSFNTDDITPLESLFSFEKIGSWNQDSSQYTFMAFSMVGDKIPSGKTALLKIGSAEISNIVLSDTAGRNVIAILGTQSGLSDIESLNSVIMNAYPNPFEKEVRLDFVVGNRNAKQATLVFTDIMGKRLDIHDITIDHTGKYSYLWNADRLNNGIYFVQLYIDGIFAHTVKLVMNK